MGENDPGHFSEFLARFGAQRVLADVEEDVGHVDDEPAGRVPGVKDEVELIEELLTETGLFVFSALTEAIGFGGGLASVLDLRHGGGAGGFGFGFRQLGGLAGEVGFGREFAGQGGGFLGFAFGLFGCGAISFGFCAGSFSESAAFLFEPGLFGGLFSSQGDSRARWASTSAWARAAASRAAAASRSLLRRSSSRRFTVSMRASSAV